MTLSRTQVLLITQLETKFSREVLHGALTYTRQHTNWQLTCQLAVSAAQQRAMHFAGGLSLAGDPQVDQAFRKIGIPLIQVGNTADESQVSSVSVDERGIGTMAAEYLAGLGLKHFAYVGHGTWPFIRERLDGFTDALRRLGHDKMHHLIGQFYDRRRRQRFERNLGAMLQALPRPCGLLAANDVLGVEIVTTCRNLGLRVPDDVAVLGVDDDELACELSEVPLSSIAQPFSSIGYEAARLLHQHLQRPRKRPTQLRLPPLRVVARASSDLIAVDDADVVAALRLINHHLAEPINVTWLIRQLPVARRSLERRFKALIGRTLLDQIHLVRFQKAKELLAESDLGLEVVAQRSGFANSRWLADSFRRELGTTPIRFRRQYRTES